MNKTKLSTTHFNPKQIQTLTKTPPQTAKTQTQRQTAQTQKREQKQSSHKPEDKTNKITNTTTTNHNTPEMLFFVASFLG